MMDPSRSNGQARQRTMDVRKVLLEGTRGPTDSGHALTNVLGSDVVPGMDMEPRKQEYSLQVMALPEEFVMR